MLPDSAVVADRRGRSAKGNGIGKGNGNGNGKGKPMYQSAVELSCLTDECFDSEGEACDTYFESLGGGDMYSINPVDTE